MINKKAQILEENTLKIILVCISIVILVGLLYMLYSGVQKSKQSEQASAILKQVGDRVNSLNSGERDVMTITGPKKWFLFAEMTELSAYKLCVCNAIKAECKLADKRCISINKGKVEIAGDNIEIYIVDLIFVKQNEIVSISKK
jgi:heme/copper-type cytochrome/quinol oxidase subunit 2